MPDFRPPPNCIQLSNGSLASGDQYVRAGIESCIVARSYGAVCTTGSWVSYVEASGVPIALPPFIRAFRINQFLPGAITTERGLRGSFVGPWTTTPIIATSNGLLPPSGTTRVSPSPLWSDGPSATFERFTCLDKKNCR